MNILKAIKTLIEGRVPLMGEIPDSLLDIVATATSIRGKFSRLSSLERVITTIRHKEPDRPPVMTLLGGAARQITGISFPEYSQDAEKAAEVFMSGFDLIGGDIIILMWDLSVEAADFGQKVIFPENSTPYRDYSDPLIKDVEDYTRLRPVSVSETRRMKEFVKLCEIMVKRAGLRALVSGFTFGPLGVLSMMRGVENLFKDCIHYPEKVIKACEAITETLLEYVQLQCDTGLPAIAIDTLYASWNGLPKHLWEAIEGPFVREMSRLIKRNGLVMGFHNCGHGFYMDSQIKFMEPDVVSFAFLPDDCKTEGELKEKYGDKITLLGYIPTQLLAHGTPKEVMDESVRQVEVFGKDGGFILAPGCEYPPNIPLTNAFAMVKAVERYSR